MVMESEAHEHRVPALARNRAYLRFRARADELSGMAGSMRDARNQVALEELAERYRRLADHLEGWATANRSRSRARNRYWHRDTA